MLAAAITSAQSAFFDHAHTLREALAVQSPEELIHCFSWGTTKARAALHVARAAARLGHLDTARRSVVLGLNLAEEGATILRSELQEVLEVYGSAAAEQAGAADSRRLPLTG